MPFNIRLFLGTLEWFYFLVWKHYILFTVTSELRCCETMALLTWWVLTGLHTDTVSNDDFDSVWFIQREL